MQKEKEKEKEKEREKPGSIEEENRRRDGVDVAERNSGFGSERS